MTAEVSKGPVARPVSDEARDDAVVPFAVEPLDVRGRVVRLGESIDHILAKHHYPTPVARLVGEACVLTVLLATSLKIEGRFQLQTRGDGAIGMLVVDFDAPDRLRALPASIRKSSAPLRGQRISSARAIWRSPSNKAMARRDIKGSLPCKGKDCRMPRGNISISRRRFQHGCVSRLRRM
jgi:Hsp33 protein